MTKFEILNALIEDTQTNPYPPSITLNSLLKKKVYISEFLAYRRSAQDQALKLYVFYNDSSLIKKAICEIIDEVVEYIVNHCEDYDFKCKCVLDDPVYRWKTITLLDYYVTHVRDDIDSIVEKEFFFKMMKNDVFGKEENAG